MDFKQLEETPYHIQRAKFENSTSRKGIDSLLSFDYMGAAEFEFGALPKSLERTRKALDEYTSFQYSFTGHPTKLVTVFCKKNCFEDVKLALELLAHNKMRLKCSCDLHYFVEGKEDKWAYTRNDFWWDIDNDWFFWKFTPGLDQKIIEAIKTKPQ